MSLDSPNISVVVLAYGNAETISGFVDSLIAVLEPEEPNWEIILVGNYFEGTGDRTPEVIRELARKDSRIHAVTRVKEGMMGWDMRSGFEAATGKTLAVIDGDGQMPCEDVLRVYKKLKKEGLDLAKPYRITRNDGPYRIAISMIYNLLFKSLFPGLKSRDINSKPKIMTREVYEAMDLRSNDWFIDAEIMIQARRMNLKIGEIDTVFRSIDSRPSFVKPLAILEFLANLLWYRVWEFRHCFRKTSGLAERQRTD